MILFETISERPTRIQKVLNLDHQGNSDNQGNFHVSKNDKNNEKRGPPGGCFICKGNHFRRQCPNLNQQQRPSLPQQQQVFQQRIHAAFHNRQAEQ